MFLSVGTIQVRALYSNLAAFIANHEDGLNEKVV